MTVPSMFRWAILDANWLGDSREICDAAASGGVSGACWVFIKVRMDVFLYGFYPAAERWRVNLIFVVLAFSLLPLAAPEFFKDQKRQAFAAAAGVIAVLIPYGTVPACFMFVYGFMPFALTRVSVLPAQQRMHSNNLSAILMGSGIACVAGLLMYVAVRSLVDANAALPISLSTVLIALFLIFVGRLSAMVWRWVLLFAVYPLFAFFLLIGGVFGLPLVETHYWGGLFLTLVVAGTGMGTALPIGILFALGRRSELPVIKTVCVSFIEFVRGVPLVSVLFMASVMFPLFLPENVTFDKLLRALVGIAFFYAAYMAEVIRGGLQAIPKGQYEAAKALGWTYWKMMGFIIMPQTLRLVIPGLANNFLSLLKDTTLVAVIGLLDLLGIAKAAMADSEWLGFTKEAYIFAAIVFWVFCFAISRYSVHLEKKYHTSYQ
jgi:general L-amino acid transport system permease protein